MSSLSNEEITESLAKARLVVIEGEVNTKLFDSVKAVIVRLLVAGAPDIAVIIDSKGGELVPGLDIFDILETYPGRKTALVYCLASSAAAIILQSCDERLCARHAEVKIHEMIREISLTVARNARQFSKWLEQAEKRQARMDRIFSERTGLSIEKIHALSKKDRSLTSEEALKYKLVDRILTKTDMAKHFGPKSK